MRDCAWPSIAKTRGDGVWSLRESALQGALLFPSRKKPWTGTCVRDVAWTVPDLLPAAKPLRLCIISATLCE
jgi:hypothetical protein